MTTTSPAPATKDPAASIAIRRVELVPYGVEVGPVTHLAAERERLSQLRFAHFEVRPLSATIGAEVQGLDLAQPLSAAALAELRQCWLDFKVLFFRDQPLTPAEHVAFARQFGELEIHPFIPSTTGQPELVRFEKEATVGGFENGWHSDVSWREVPSAGAVLHGIEIPPVGGDTLFADMYAAYDGLSEDLKAEIDGLEAVHDFTKVFGHTLDDDAKVAMQQRYPSVTHPVVRTHEETGRKLLYVNRFFTSHILGLEEAASIELINQLAAQAELVEYQCRFSWQPDSVAFWDNRAVQHYASSDYWPQRRVVERASIIGSRPR